MESLLERIRHNKCSFGLNISFVDPVILECAKQAGYDFVRLDCEHILFDKTTITTMLREARLLELPLQIRVPSLTDVTALLDMGAIGIMVPHLESESSAKAAVQAVKYAPLGDRGMTGAARVLGLGRIALKDYVAKANAEIVLIGQIESQEGLTNIDAILAVPGLDMVATGRNDLSQALGVPGQNTHPKVLAAEDLIIQKALAAGKQPTILVKNTTRLQELYRKGVRCFSIERDDLLFTKAAKAHLEIMQEALNSTAGTGEK
jgi:2-keto-3-deoxy-L-rhamnonate aldolase RhmA